MKRLLMLTLIAAVSYFVILQQYEIYQLRQSQIKVQQAEAAQQRKEEAIKAFNAGNSRV
jgi:hypothetical protein